MRGITEGKDINHFYSILKDNDKQLLSFMMLEYRMLKSDISSIIRCQTSYLLGSIGAAGASIGMGLGFSGIEITAENENAINLYKLLAFFAPVILTALSSCLYFDKTSLLSRISGYLRVLENIIVYFDSKHNLFIGFESYNSLYRNVIYSEYLEREKDRENNTIKYKNSWRNFFYINPFLYRVISYTKLLVTKALLFNDSGLVKVITFKMPNQHIYITWWLYFLLSTMCIILEFASYSEFKHTDNLIISATITVSICVYLFSTIYTLYIVRELVDGNSRSQSRREKQCWNILYGKDDFIDYKKLNNNANYIISPLSLIKLLFIAIIVYILLALHEGYMDKPFNFLKPFNMLNPNSLNPASPFYQRKHMNGHNKNIELDEHRYVCKDVSHPCEIKPSATPTKSPETNRDEKPEGQAR